MKILVLVPHVEKIWISKILTDVSDYDGTTSAVFNFILDSLCWPVSSNCREILQKRLFWDKPYNSTWELVEVKVIYHSILPRIWKEELRSSESKFWKIGVFDFDEQNADTEDIHFI